MECPFAKVCNYFQATTPGSDSGVCVFDDDKLRCINTEANKNPPIIVRLKKNPVDLNATLAKIITGTP